MVPLVEIVKPFVIHYGYWAVFLGVFLESFGLPLPGETLIIVAGLVASKGLLNLTWAMVIAIIGTFIANNFSYMGGYLGGRKFLLKYSKFTFMDEKKLRVLENFFKRHGSKMVVVARFIIGMRQFNGFLAGMAHMPMIKFGLFNMLGAVLWVGWWMGMTYYFGRRFDHLFIKYYFILGILGLVVVLISFRYFFKNSNNQLASESSVEVVHS